MTKMIRFVAVFVFICLSFCLGSESSTVSSNSILPEGYSKNQTKEGLNKRGIQVESISRKSYDPPPEYYRGPTSSSSSSSSYNNNNNNNNHRDSTAAEFTSRPVAFPKDNYGYKGSSSSSWSNNGQEERKNHHDRVSVEHYGSDSSHSGYEGQGYGGTSGAQPYGPAQAFEYEYYAPTGNSQGGYSEGAERIPVELYNRGYGGYGHAGEYATYPIHGMHGGVEGGHVGPGVGHHNGKHGYDKVLLAKSFLIPLASAAVLGIAAALASNPLLLQLGTVSAVGKRKKRETDEKLVHSVAYRGQRRN